jgi:hypothetical protein
VNEDFYGSISAPPQNRFLGGMANFMKFLEQEKPEFLPSQLDVMGLMRQLALPSSQTVENLSYGNSPFTMPPQGTGAMIPQVKTGRKPEVADLIGMISGVPGGKAVIDSGTKISQDALNAYMKMIRETPPVGAVNPSAAMPQIPQPQKSDLGFYSQLEAATIPLQNKGTGTQFLAQIEKTPGVKPEEIKFTGLDEFLRNRETVTKPEIQQFLDQNRVNLQEVRLGQGTVKSFDQWAADQGFGPEAIRDFGPTLRNSYEAFKENASQKIGAAKFSQYVLPGGENYREILLTLPRKEKTLTEIERELGYRTGDLTVAQQEEVLKRWKQFSDESSDYTSSHFDQPNILAHMRVNDRVVDGKKTLFIEEIQSDWHQAGRKKGYDTPEARAAEQQKLDNILAERQQLLAEQRRLEELALPYTNQGQDAPSEIIDQWSIVSNRLNNLQTEQNRLGRGFGQQVPDAPFKTSWHELSLKRAIQEASEKGYDKIAFTTGQTQAARYDLSKQLESVQLVSPQKDSLKGTIFNGYRKGSNEIVNRLINTEDELVELVGKDVADKLLKQNATKGTGGNAGSSIKKLEGVDLQVGGEGMKGFYDNILPKSLEKLGKKFDAKVGKTTMDGTEVWQMDITPKMRESVLTKGQPLFQVAPAIPAGGLLGQDEE